jgi:hypothetical protein
MLTKEQLEKFNEHFMLTEVTHDVTTYVYETDDLEQLNELYTEEIENGIMYLDTIIKDSYTESSQGYTIELKNPRLYIRDIYELSNLVEFIQDQMGEEIERYKKETTDTKQLNNFLETDSVDLNKGPMFTELVQNLKMTPQEQIEQMLWDNDEYLGGDAYEDIITSEYDSIVSVLDQAIEAYKKTDIYEITDDNEERIIGTHKDKMNALANYLRRVANDIEEKD